MRSWFEWVGAMESSIALRESLNAYPIMLTSHVIGMCMFAGLIMMMDLRLAGVGNLNSSITQVQGRLFPWQMFGFAISIVTGLFLLFSDPMRFYTNFYFWTKNVLLVLAGLNMWYFHATTYQTVDQWDNDPSPPFGAKCAGVLSIAFWSSIIVVGRMIAYQDLVPQWWRELVPRG
ncbi:MAG: hypothetical protein OXG72_09240 [Acidobacteria bacterium]|nr:hypothetical protein [Acidobacteriota bacterium]